MTLDLSADDVLWSLDASWVILPRRPGAHVLRRQAQAFGATHYGTVDKSPCLIGFFSFPAARGRRRVNPLAPPLATAFGPGVYAEILLENGAIWIVATDRAGRLQTGTDRIIASGDLEAFRQRFSEADFPDRRTIEGEELDQLITTLRPLAVHLHEATLRGAWKPVAAGLATLVLIGGGVHAWKAHQQRVAEAERLQRMRLAQSLAAHRSRVDTPVPPSAWVAGCLNTAMAQPLFHGGWIQTSWSCSGNTLTLHWARDGGTLQDAPAGQIANSSNDDTQTIPISFSRERRAAATKDDGLRRLVSALQGMGLQPQISEAPVENPAPIVRGTSLSWQFPTDPRSFVWDTISGLTIRTIGHENHLATGNYGGVGIDVSYSMSATIEHASAGNQPR